MELSRNGRATQSPCVEVNGGCLKANTDSGMRPDCRDRPSTVILPPRGQGLQGKSALSPPSRGQYHWMAEAFSPGADEEHGDIMCDKASSQPSQECEGSCGIVRQADDSGCRHYIAEMSVDALVLHLRER
ncbi:hypothetical protein AAFF_G00422260 [Aldrovandia affinis]|uniref:Uncharacterized protein n=1 Tax=Aldrovandia affinis TaxID=143900 RepID=A0AAD7R3B7_9TELE|nr:hypothetical protein AAFF_G00422260 [Aldrovandia affinis]